MSVTTKWWSVEEDRILCDLCPRHCSLHEGQRGFCFVRQNVAGQMELTTYGKSTGFCIDPIEKKPLSHFLPGTPVLSFGTAGCNLGCKFCQNWDISKARQIERLSESARPETIATRAKELGCRSVAFTYNDPVIWAEYAIDTAIACREAGLKTVAVTAGYITPAARPDFYSVMDAANVDLKAFTEDFYKSVTYSKLEPVLDTLRWLAHESNVWFEITDLMIPGENDSPDEVARMVDWLVANVGEKVPVHFTAFHPDYRMLDTPRTPHETLIRAREQAISAGIQFAYVGNVNDVERQSTYCPYCKTLLIERDWHELGVYRMRGNRCGQCDAVIPGVFEERPGDWGRRRQTVQIQDPEPVALHFVDAAALASSAAMLSPRADASSTASSSGAAVLNSRLKSISLSAPDETELAEGEIAEILAFARGVVESEIRSDATPPGLSEAIAESPCFGVFVTLRRGSLLRGCRGHWGTKATLKEAIAKAARDVATRDPRFPGISAEELPLLKVEVSLMFDPRVIAAKGDDRARHIDVGRHGLVISHARGRGLLLPQVARSTGWTATNFLARVCEKAGLEPTTWTEDAAELMAFQARVLESDSPVLEFDPQSMGPAELDRLVEFANAALEDRPLDDRSAPFSFKRRHLEELGVCVESGDRYRGVAFGRKRSLLELAIRAARSLRSRGRASARRIERVTLLWQPIPLRCEDPVARHRSLSRSAIVGRTKGRLAVTIPPPSAKRTSLEDVLSSLGLSHAQWRGGQVGDVRITAFSSIQHTWSGSGERETARKPAVAGRFYPGDPKRVEELTAQYLSQAFPRDRKAVWAVMLPHAGWAYCGAVIGKTLGRIDVPDLVIAIGPKHTSAGPRWSVSAADRWEIPGASIPVAAAVRDRLLELEPNLVLDDAAHRNEHAIEVLLPFLYRCNPRLQIVPLAQGATAYEGTASLAKALAAVIAESSIPPLLVISSDMNHFATAEENRRLDFLALDAMRTGDPENLYRTVRTSQISMCGALPAVTVMQALLQAHGPISVELIDYAHSGQVSGDNNRVVGYAGMLLGKGVAGTETRAM